MRNNRPKLSQILAHVPRTLNILSPDTGLDKFLKLIPALSPKVQ